VLEVAAAEVAGFFTPERPGPLLHAHVASTGVGRCAADRRRDPRTVLVELPGGNVAVRGVPVPLPDLRGLVEAPPEWLPALEAVDPGLAAWPRLVSVLPPSVDVPAPAHPVRRLGPADAAALERLHPSIAWISETWDGPAGLAASSRAWAAFVDERPIAVACSFYVGSRFEDVGVVTDPDNRGRGLSTACAAALVADIRRRGRQPTWTTSPDNLASRAVADRLRFVHERDDVLYAVRTPIPPVD
jgi:GNAT superfamily N-acetyltransferase